MEHSEEYHDPDYPEALVTVKEEAPSVSEDDKIEKIKQIIRREFKNELAVRENEVLLIDQRYKQRMLTARRYLHQVRYSIVNNCYKDQKLQLTNSQIEDDVAAQTEPRARAEVSSILRDSQRRLHPSVRKLLGKKNVDLDELLRTRGPRNKTRKNYCAMLKRNYTVPEDATTTLRPPTDKPEEVPGDPEKKPEEAGCSKPKKIPRRINPKVNNDNIITLDEVTRNKKKHRFRIIIGNTSKYAPPASRADKSTHKWLLYVRAPPPRDVSVAVSAVTVQLHHSYAPHHTVYMQKPPFQVSRRGWGEFPARVTLHFALPEVNRPATITHTIKLDRHYTGLQTLGAETVADVWLYSTPDMLQCEFKADDEESFVLEKPIPEVKEEPKLEENVEENELKTVKTEHVEEYEENFNTNGENDSWLDFFSKDTSQVNVDEMFNKNVNNEISTSDALLEQDQTDVQPERIMKYIEPNTGKIYYLKMDINLDLSTVKEVIIHQEPKNNKNGVKTKKTQSLLKPDITIVKNEDKSAKNNFSHIENDHCYVKNDFCFATEQKSSFLDDLRIVVSKFSCAKMVVNFLLKKIPLISSEFGRKLPFVVENDEKYWKLDFAKRRNIEWSRAKLINKMLSEQFKDPKNVWRTKQILIYSRLHGHYPIRPETIRPEQTQPGENEWSSWIVLDSSRSTESNIRELYPSACEISTLSVFDGNNYSQSDEIQDLCESDEELDIVSNSAVKVKRKVLQDCVDRLKALPVAQEDKLKFFYIENKCSDIGVELRNEDVGEGYSYSAVHAVLLSAMKSFAEELIRCSLADQLSYVNDRELPTIWTGSSSRTVVQLEHVFRAARTSRLRLLSKADLAAEKKQTHAL